MQTPVDFSGRPFHFIGIGGIGMSALAHILIQNKLPVSGSDLRPNSITQKLQQQGAHIFQRQDASNLQYFVAAAKAIAPEQNPGLSHALLPQVVCSTAIREDNSEYRAALELGCPILHRSDLLAALIQRYQGIAVAGTHGKTTTSSLIGYLLLQGDLDPTIVVGGEVKAWQGNARLGDGPFLVAEADESDGSLVKFAPQIGVITNIELDHPDHYSSLDQVLEIFQTFASHCQTVVTCWDCPTIRDRLADLPHAISYSLNPEVGADYTATDIVYDALGTSAKVWERGECLGLIRLPLLGQHNLKNALAAIAVSRLAGLEFAAIADALVTFEGARRRFEVRGEAHGIRFIDDYAHHPSELQATLASARLQVEGDDTPWQRVVAVFQPHRYSRTHTFLTEFSQSFADADLVVLTDIYSAGEPDTGLVKGEHLAAMMAEYRSQVHFQPTLSEVTSFLKQTLKPGDLVLFLGAGNLNQQIPEVLAHFQHLETAVPAAYSL